MIIDIIAKRCYKYFCLGPHKYRKDGTGNFKTDYSTVLSQVICKVLYRPTRQFHIYRSAKILIMKIMNTFAVYIDDWDHSFYHPYVYLSFITQRPCYKFLLNF